MDAGHYKVRVGEPPDQVEHDVELVPPNLVRVDGQELQIEAAADGSWRVGTAGGLRRVHIAGWNDQEVASATIDGHVASLRVRSARTAALEDMASSGSDLAGSVVKAPMPGRVVKIQAAVGDTVKGGAPLLILEAMKMENEVTATGEGVVTSIAVDVGQAVETGETLVVIEAPQD